MKNNNKIISLIFAFIFSLLYTFFIKGWRFSEILDISTLILFVTNFLTVLFIISFFNKIQRDNLQKPISKLKKQLLPSFILFVVVTILVSLIIFSLGDYALYLVKGWSTDSFLQNLFRNDIPGTFIHLSVGIFVASVIFFYATWRQAINRENKLREENLKYRYRNLKAQVNPHFLFNSLNTLSEMVYDDPVKADNYIQELSSVYRYILENEETDLVLLSKELQFVKQYFDLHRERHRDKIILNMDVRNTSELMIIPVSLQILVENALKHNSASGEKPLEIYIYNNDDYIEVRNNIRKKDTLKSPSGTGLSNLKKRVNLITGKEIIVSENNNEFSVSIPIVKA